jgi:hypothetical protein
MTSLVPASSSISKSVFLDPLFIWSNVTIIFSNQNTAMFLSFIYFGQLL